MTDKPFVYRGVKYQIEPNPAFGFLLSCHPTSKYLEYMAHDDVFLREDTGHSHNEGQTDEEKINYLHNVAREQIDDLLSETIIDKKQQVHRLENEIKQLERHKKTYPKGER